MIRSIGAISPNPVKSSPVVDTGNKIGGSFKAMFDEVNQEQLNADNMIAGMVSGTNKDVPATMIAMEKAETSMKMLMAVRNKMVAAYEETMRMQF